MQYNIYKKELKKSKSQKGRVPGSLAEKRRCLSGKAAVRGRQDGLAAVIFCGRQGE